MFYSHDLLGRKSPLGAIWTIAHGKKLSKNKVLGINVQDICAQILHPDVPHSLRLQGILIGGVVVLFSKQTVYLLEDVNEMVKRVKDATALESSRANGKATLQRGKDKARPEAITRGHDEDHGGHHAMQVAVEALVQEEDIIFVEGGGVMDLNNLLMGRPGRMGQLPLTVVRPAASGRLLTGNDYEGEEEDEELFAVVPTLSGVTTSVRGLASQLPGHPEVSFHPKRSKRSLTQGGDDDEQDQEHHQAYLQHGHAVPVAVGGEDELFIPADDELLMGDLEDDRFHDDHAMHGMHAADGYDMEVDPNNMHANAHAGSNMEETGVGSKSRNASNSAKGASRVSKGYDVEDEEEHVSPLFAPGSKSKSKLRSKSTGEEGEESDNESEGDVSVGRTPQELRAIEDARRQYDEHDREQLVEEDEGNQQGEQKRRAGQRRGQAATAAAGGALKKKRARGPAVPIDALEDIQIRAKTYREWTLDTSELMARRGGYLGGDGRAAVAAGGAAGAGMPPAAAAARGALGSSAPGSVCGKRGAGGSRSGKGNDTGAAGDSLASLLLKPAMAHAVCKLGLVWCPELQHTFTRTAFGADATGAGNRGGLDADDISSDEEADEQSGGGAKRRSVKRQKRTPNGQPPAAASGEGLAADGAGHSGGSGARPASGSSGLQRSGEDLLADEYNDQLPELPFDDVEVERLRAGGSSVTPGGSAGSDAMRAQLMGREPGSHLMRRLAGTGNTKMSSLSTAGGTTTSQDLSGVESEQAPSSRRSGDGALRDDDDDLLLPNSRSNTTHSRGRSSADRLLGGDSHQLGDMLMVVDDVNGLLDDEGGYKFFGEGALEDLLDLGQDDAAVGAGDLMAEEEDDEWADKENAPPSAFNSAARRRKAGSASSNPAAAGRRLATLPSADPNGRLTQFQLMESSGLPTQLLKAGVPAPNDSISKATMTTVQVVRQRLALQQQQQQQQRVAGGDDVGGDQPSVSFFSLVSRLRRSEAVKLFVQVLVTQSTSYVRASQGQPYGDIHLRAGRFM